VLAIAGIYLFVTGSAGYCPIYRRLGWDTQLVQRERDDEHSNRRWLNRLGSEGRQRWLMLFWCLSMLPAIPWVVLEGWGS